MNQKVTKQCIFAEQEMILAAKKGDSEAFDLLFIRYLPMVRKIYRHYFLREFDEDDWQQEARIVCYKTILIYNPESQMSFVRFYQLNFKHHVFSLIRKETALKRQAHRQAVSLEALQVDCQGETRMTQEVVNETFESAEERSIVSEDVTDFITSLSTFEKQTLTYYLQAHSLEATANLLDCQPKQIKNGLDRCRQKLKIQLFEN